MLLYSLLKILKSVFLCVLILNSDGQTVFLNSSLLKAIQQWVFVSTRNEGIPTEQPRREVSRPKHLEDYV